MIACWKWWERDLLMLGRMERVSWRYVRLSEKRDM